MGKSKVGLLCNSIDPTYKLKCLKPLGHNGFHKAERPQPSAPDRFTHVILWHRRGICGNCGKDFRIREDNTLFAHGSKTGPPFEKDRKSTRFNSSLECDGSWSVAVHILDSEILIENGS